MFPLRLAFYLLFLLANPASGSTQKIADRIYYGGEIVTADDAKPQAQAVAVRDGRIIGVGRLAEIVRLRGAETELFDLDGRTLMPGFVDAHSHLSRTGLQAISANLMRPPNGRSRTMADIVWTLRKWKQTQPPARKFGLILGFGYEESQFGRSRGLSRDHLDAVSTELPVIAIHRSGKRGVFNTVALKLAGIDSETPDGNGVLEGTLHDIALRRILGKLAEKNFTTLIEAAQQLYIRFGHTTVQDSAPGPPALEAYSKIAASGQLKIDVIAYPDLTRDRVRISLSGPRRSRNYANGFRIGGIVLHFADMAHSSARGEKSWLRQTSGTPPGIGGADGSGDTAHLAAAFRNAWQVIALPHSPRGAGRFLSALCEAMAAAPAEKRRAVLILDRNLNPEHLKAVCEARVIPFLLAAPLPGEADKPGVDPPLGVAPVSFLLRHGIPFTAGHGAPNAPPDLLRVMAAMIRQAEDGDPDFRAPAGAARMAALKAVTLWAARQYFEEEAKGSITAGKLADLTILSDNPMTADAKALANIRVLETIKEGATIFVRGNDDRQPSLACAHSAPCFSGITAALFHARSTPGTPPLPGPSARLRE